MPGMPELPLNVPTDQRQEDGRIDKEPVYQTHRGKKPTSRSEGGLPPTAAVPDGPLRWEDD